MTHVELLDRLDAAVFTGDAFHDQNNRNDFIRFMARWLNELAEVEAKENDHD